MSVAFADERSALRGVTFEIRHGQRLALVGPSGSGKSSIAALLLRFIDPDQGEIWVDGQRLADIPAEAWRAKVAWVPQSPYLMNDTVEANIRLARPEASREQVIQAARQAEADEFIRLLPQGYETLVGERGVRLSGGEAQRIALARAFLKDASLVILDEATANLDPVSEARLQSGMRRLMAGRSVLVIAHRLNTVTQADQIIVLEQGRVVQTGTHAGLSQQTGLYRNLVSALQARAWSEPMAGKLPAGYSGLLETEFPEPEFPEPEGASVAPLAEIDLPYCYKQLRDGCRSGCAWCGWLRR